MGSGCGSERRTLRKWERVSVTLVLYLVGFIVLSLLYCVETFYQLLVINSVAGIPRVDSRAVGPTCVLCGVLHYCIRATPLRFSINPISSRRVATHKTISRVRRVGVAPTLDSARHSPIMSVFG